LAIAMFQVGLSCAPTVLERRFDPAASEPERLPPLRQVEGLRIWVVAMRYSTAWVELRVRVENLGDADASLSRDGLLLAHSGLEYPVDVETTPEPEFMEDGIVMPASLRLAPEDSRTIALHYRLTRPMAQTGTLVIRTLRVGGTPVGPVELPLPPHPTSEDAG
jgi:hypothetical protein